MQRTPLVATWSGESRILRRTPAIWDGSKYFEYAGSQISPQVTLGLGTHRLTVQARDRVTGTWYRKTIYVTVQ